MTTNTTPEAIELMQFAKTQASDVNLLLRKTALVEDTAYIREMQAVSHSVVDCLLEGLNTLRPVQFQKNFLVIAKSYNAELAALFFDYFNSNRLSAETFEAFSQVNKLLELRVVSAIRQLQHAGRRHEKETTLTSTKQ